MVSAVLSREFGFGFYRIKIINEARRGKRYADEDAATYLLGIPLKKDLEESPFIRIVEYGGAANRRLLRLLQNTTPRIRTWFGSWTTAHQVTAPNCLLD